MRSAAYAALSRLVLAILPIFSMALLAAGCLLLLLRLPYSVFGSNCDLGASDVIFLVKASHLMSREDFGNVKELMKEFSNTLDIGRDNTTTHVGIVFFDNIGPPQTRIPLSAHGRISDLTTAIDGLARLPCGSGWCKEKESSFRPAIDYTMSRFPKGRMKKIVIVYSGTEDPKLGGEVADLTSKDPWLKIYRIFIKGNIVTSEEPNYNYLQAYHDPYKRYADRMSQLFPNVTVEIPPQPTPIPIPKQIEQGKMTVSLSDELPKIGDEVCQQIFSCPPCGAISGGIDPFDRETPIQSRLPENWKSNLQDSRATTKTSGGNSDDYEYEITADPPGMTINTNPAKNRREMSTTTPMSSMDYVYEESVDDDRGMRSKRAVMSPRQKDCSCSLSIPSPAVPPTTFSVDSPSEGCTGSSEAGSGCGATALPGAGCGGSSETPGAGCSAAAPQHIAYTQAYAQSPYPAHQPSYYPYIQQYSSPCRLGSPCARRPYHHSYSGYSPCGNRMCSYAQQQYPPQQNYQRYYNNYNYWYQSQQQQPIQVVQQTQGPFVPQPYQPSYATPSSLPSFDSSSIHDGGSETDKKTTITKVTKEDLFGQIEKIDKPDDPFSAKAFGDSQFTKISSGGLLEGLFPVNLPPINTLLSKFDPSAEDFGTSIPPRPVTLKPVDVGSHMTDIEDPKGAMKRVHRQ